MAGLLLAADWAVVEVFYHRMSWAARASYQGSKDWTDGYCTNSVIHCAELVYLTILLAVLAAD